MTLDVNDLSAFYASPLGEVVAPADRPGAARALGELRGPVDDGPRLLRPLSRPLSRRGAARAGADAGRAGRRRTGRRPAARRPRWCSATCCRCRTPASIARSSRMALETAEHPERGARGGVAGAGAGRAGDRRRALAARRLGAGRRHAVRPRPAVFAKRSCATWCATRCSRRSTGARRSTRRRSDAVLRQFGAGDRAHRRGGRLAFRGRAYRRGDQAGLSAGRRAAARAPTRRSRCEPALAPTARRERAGLNFAADWRRARNVLFSAANSQLERRNSA